MNADDNSFKSEEIIFSYASIREKFQLTIEILILSI
ncbi:hypothetical protein PAU_01519 [Photorhabdus asymbiotica]|uniref:Uncharacterized protein n=1 Tax=Photorhabdus asymbiotica subsp. asymbiotica (strain ATCC 43949 / 3105-77) TaxID=553480 RepID=C7BRP1_PHOAA|nr:hypothetical protein PAU_01519 [Photorhabdus asymbiotica]